jgi:hypothetical protein
MLKLSIQRVGSEPCAPVPVPGRQAEVWRDREGTVSAYAEIIDQHYWMHLPGLASFCFSDRSNEITATVSDHIPVESVLDAYNRKVLPLALQVQGREVLHASAVCSPAGVTALCGISETGKSTIAFALSRRGYRLWADDSVTLEINGRGPLAISLPFKSRLRPAPNQLFNSDADRPPTNREYEAESSIFETAPLSAICVLRREGQHSPTVVRRVSSSQALRALLDHACCFIPQHAKRKRQMIKNYLEIVADIPIYDVCFQSGLENLPAVLDAIERVITQCAERTT